MSAENGDEDTIILSNSQTYLSGFISMLLGIFVSNIIESTISEMLSSRTFLFHAFAGLLVGVIIGLLVVLTVTNLASGIEYADSLTTVKDAPIIGEYLLTLVLLISILIILWILTVVEFSHPSSSCPPGAECSIRFSGEYLTLIGPIAAPITTLTTLGFAYSSN